MISSNEAEKYDEYVLLNKKTKEISEDINSILSLDAGEHFCVTEKSILKDNYYNNFKRSFIYNENEYTTLRWLEEVFEKLENHINILNKGCENVRINIKCIIDIMFLFLKLNKLIDLLPMLSLTYSSNEIFVLKLDEFIKKISDYYNENYNRFYLTYLELKKESELIRNFSSVKIIDNWVNEKKYDKEKLKNEIIQIFTNSENFIGEHKEFSFIENNLDSSMENIDLSSSIENINFDLNKIHFEENEKLDLNLDNEKSDSIEENNTIEESDTKPIEESNTFSIQDIKTNPIEESETKPIEESNTNPIEESNTILIQNIKTNPIDENNNPIQDIKPNSIEENNTNPIQDIKLNPIEESNTISIQENKPIEINEKLDIKIFEDKTNIFKMNKRQNDIDREKFLQSFFPDKNNDVYKRNKNNSNSLKDFYSSQKNYENGFKACDDYKIKEYSEKKKSKKISAVYHLEHYSDNNSCCTLYNHNIMDFFNALDFS